jgi:hypothetical protein
MRHRFITNLFSILVAVTAVSNPSIIGSVSDLL